MRLASLMRMTMGLLAVAAFGLFARGDVEAQLRSDTPPEFAGGYDPRFCSYPREPKRAGISGCCLMTLQISEAGQVTGATGECTDPVFLEPAQRCLSVQQFRPARRGGLPVAAEHRLEYEWRSSRGDSVCGKLKLS